MVLKRGVLMHLKGHYYTITALTNNQFTIETVYGWKFHIPITYFGVKVTMSYSQVTPRLSWKGKKVHKIIETSNSSTAYMHFYPEEFKDTGVYYVVRVEDYDPKNVEKMFKSTFTRSGEAEPTYNYSLDPWASDVWHDLKKEYTIEGVITRIYSKEINKTNKIPELDLTKKNHIRMVIDKNIYVLLYGRETYFKVPLQYLTFNP